MGRILLGFSRTGLQELRQTVVPGLLSPVGGGAALVISHSRVGVILQEQLDQVVAPTLRRPMQWPKSSRLSRMRICTRLQEQLNHTDVAPKDRRIERSDPAQRLAPKVRIGARLKKRLDHLAMPKGRC